jgi:hypothetical protein
MDLREAIEAYANEVSNWDYYDNRGDDKRLAESLARLAVRSRSLDVQLAVAEAAIAIVEQQEACGHNEFADVVMRLGELWDQYRAARNKARAANQS